MTPEILDSTQNAIHGNEGERRNVVKLFSRLRIVASHLASHNNGRRVVSAKSSLSISLLSMKERRLSSLANGRGIFFAVRLLSYLRCVSSQCELTTREAIATRMIVAGLALASGAMHYLPGAGRLKSRVPLRPWSPDSSLRRTHS